MGDITSWVSVLVLGCGLYCLYAAFVMKTKGIINANIFLGKDTRYKKCKDEKGFIKKMFPQLLLFGIVTTASGAIDLINSYVVDIFMLNCIMLVVFVLEFLWFAKVNMDAKKEFY